MWMAQPRKGCDVKMAKTEYLGPAWGNWKLEYKRVLRTGLIGGVKVNPDIYQWELTGDRTMPGNIYIERFETEQDALNKLRMLVGV